MLKKTHSDSLCFRVVAGLLLLGLGAMAESVKVSGIGHGLYAKPDEKSRVSTLPEGTVLAVRETSRDGWIKVAPPPSAECWIYRESVKDGRISSSRGRIRTAPLQTAPEIGSLSRGAAVEVREEQREWVRITPPDAVSFWVKRDAVSDTKEAPTKAPPPPPRPVPVTQPPPPPPTTQPPPANPPLPPAPVPDVPVAPAVPPPVPPTTRPPVSHIDTANIPPAPLPPPPTTSHPSPPPTTRPATPTPVTWAPPPTPTTQPPAARLPQTLPITPVPHPVPTTRPVPPAPVTRPPQPVSAPASGPTVSWPVPVTSSSAHTPAPSTSDWDTFGGAATPPSGHAGTAAVPVASPAAGSSGTHLPCRSFRAPRNAPSPGTLLSRRKPTDDNIVAPVPKGILRDRLRSDLYQGDTGRATGVLVRDDGGIGLHPSPYSISVLRGDGSTERLAYVLGDEAQLSRHVGKRVQVEGTCWWIAGASATLSPTSIRPIP